MPVTGAHPMNRETGQRYQGSGMVLEARSGRDAQRAPGAAAPAAAIGPVRQAPAVRRHARVVWSLIGLRMAGNVLRSRRSYELMIVGAIMVAALARQARENQAQILARLIAWDRQRRQALRRQLPARPGRRGTR
jgi:hypothetical protein